MFWLAVLYHVRNCYVMTTRQPCFNIYAGCKTIYNIDITAWLARPLENRRKAVWWSFWRRNKLHYTVTNRKYCKVAGRPRLWIGLGGFKAKPNEKLLSVSKCKLKTRQEGNIPIEEESTSDIQRYKAVV